MGGAPRRHPLMSGRWKTQSATVPQDSSSAHRPARPSRWLGGEPPALMNRDQKLVGSAVKDARPAGKPIQPCTQVAGVQLPRPGSEAATSIATNAPAVVAMVPIVFRV